MPPSYVHQVSVNSSSAIDVYLRQSFNTDRTNDSRLLFELLKCEYDGKNWSGKYLREQFNQKNLKHLFLKYKSRIQLSSFTVGLIFIILLCILRLMTTLVYTKIWHTIAYVCLYGVTCLFSAILLVLILTEKFVIWNWKWFPPIIISVILLLLLVIPDCAYIITNIRNCYTTRLSPTFIYILITYFFLPWPKLYMAMVSAIVISLGDLVLSAFIFYARLQGGDSEKLRVDLLMADVIFLVASNFLGLYRTYLDDLDQRRAVLDHHMCIESQIENNLEKVQEEHLMLSVVPPYILDNIKTDIRDCIQLRHLEPRRARLFGDFYIKKHSNVSVLFSDIVNFTVLTCTLEVHELVILLSRLFGQFDEITSKNGCERIRIVGDCYVAASGLPPNHLSSMHARDCVEQALGMLEIIRDVKGELNVNVDMRIGVHSGQVMSGILGIRKWQYDIWSKDVDLANVMEQTGRPGLIHISEATFKLLGGDQAINSATATMQDGNDIVLGSTVKRHCCVLETVEEEDEEGVGDSTLPLLGGAYHCRAAELVQFDSKDIPTYFIIPMFPDSEECHEDKQLSRYLVNRRRVSGVPSTKTTRLQSVRRLSLQTVSSSDSLLSSAEHSPLELRPVKDEKLIKRANREMSIAIDNLALSKKEQWSNTDRLHPLLLRFKMPYSEKEFLKQADPMFKCYLLAVAFTFVALFLINALTTSSNTFYFILSFVVAMLPLTLLLYCAWHDTIVQPSSRSVVSKWSRNIATSFIARIIIWFTVAVILSLLIASDVYFFDKMVMHCSVPHCSSIQGSDPGLCVFIKDFNCASNLTSMGYDIIRLNNARYYTYSAALVMTTVALFLHIHFAMKLLVYLLALLAYYLVTFFLRKEFVYETFLPGHYIVNNYPVDQSVYITLILLCHCLMDHHTEYLSRLDFIWKQDLKAKQQDSNIMTMVNKFLVQNIVPLHVIDYFLNLEKLSEESQATKWSGPAINCDSCCWPTKKFYHERHDKVAIMFASVQNFFYFDDEDKINCGLIDSELTSLKLLNEVITSMDQLLLRPEFSRVEKIKVVGTTYMAAAGLRPNVQRNPDEQQREPVPRFDVQTNVRMLVDLATAMMHTLETFNRCSFQDYDLRVGIDCGPSMAGVVGNNKPIYDVWGNAVNVASRMESTGEIGKIQVTQETAAILEKVGYDCECRGQVFVKGKGILTTYFVKAAHCSDLSSNYEQQRATWL